MFTNAKVGYKVFSKYYGIGTIVGLDIGSHYPIEVKFTDIETTADYTLQGEYWCKDSGEFGNDTDRNITPVNIRLGSPDARRIVAMLARNYRKYNSCWCATNCSCAEIHGALLYQYTQAKQLLGEHK